MVSTPPLQHGSEVGLLRWTAVLLGPIALSAIMVAFRGQLFATNAALVLVLPVLAAAILAGRVGGAASAGIATLCFDFFFTRPYYSFTINRRDDVETTIVLLIVGLVVGELVVRSRRNERLAIASRREVDQVRRVAELAAGAGSRERLIRVVEREVVELLGARGARFERTPFPTTLPRLGHGVVTLPGENADTDRPDGPSNEIELPVWGKGREIGRLVLVLPTDSLGVAIPSADRAIAVTLVDQLGALLAAANDVS